MLCLIVSKQTTIQADIVKGRVVDAETKEPLPEASVKLTQRYGDYGTMINSLKADSLGCFSVFASGRGSIEVSMLGYYSKSKPVLAFSNSRKDTLDIGDIELKMSPQMLKMVEVTGRARRFTVKGDTIVFHPEAFHLQEGARLDELIRKLPGVEVDGQGKMSWNGKPIRITMDGESFLGGDDLVKQLPAEAVENIKAYNKQSEFSERTGRDDGKQDMVLDLTIKPGFLDRWYGDVKAGYLTEKYYDGELLMNRLSKSDPVMVFANANNVDKHWRRNMNGSTANMGNGFGKEHGASAGYQHNWQHKEGTHDLKNHYSITGGVAHDDDQRNDHQVTENYFPGSSATRSTSEDYRRNHRLEPRLKADLRWVRDTLNTFTLSASAEHTSSRTDSRQTTTQEELPAPNITYVATLSQLNTTHTDGRKTTLNTKAGWEHYVKDGALGASITLNYQEGKINGQTERTITAHNQSYTSSQLIQTYNSPSTQISTTAEAHHARWLTKQWMVQAQYSLTYSRNRNERDFTTDGVTDAANSYHDLYTRNEHSLQLSQTINLAPFQLMPNVKARWQRESQDYRRGTRSFDEGGGWGLDTAAVRRSLFIDPSLRATWKLSNTAGFELNYSLTTRQPDIIQTIGYRDLTDPLFITEGNPNLRDTHTHDVRLTYNMVLAHCQTSLSATVSYNHNDRETTTALSYNPTTAVYVSRPENVKGSRSWNFRLNFDQGLGDYFRLQSDFRMNTSQRYGFLTLLPTQSERTENRQSSLNPRENLTLSLDYNWLKASVFTEISADRLRYTASPEQNTTHWDNNYGLRVEATHGAFIFYTTLTERTSRGYTIGSMNRDILVWDAAIGWKFLKNKARLGLEFDDILNNEDGRWSQQSAYQQSTSWQDFRHHYVGIRFTYHLDAKKKDTN
jgi:hypothetical protein